MSVQQENTGSSNSSSDLSIVELFDDLMRLIKQKRSEKVEEAFSTFAENMKSIWIEWQNATSDCGRLQNLLEARTQELSEMERNLMVARKLLDQEKKRTRLAEQERDNLKMQMSKVQNLTERVLKDQHSKLADETREQLEYFNKGRRSLGDPNANSHLTAIPEVNSTGNNISHTLVIGRRSRSSGSILSEFSYSRSEDDLDSSKCFQTGREWRKHRASSDAPPEPAVKKRRSSSNKVVEIGAADTVRATTTLTVPKEGPITATSVIESIPIMNALSEPATPSTDYGSTAPPINLILESWARDSPRASERNAKVRQHCFQPKTVVMPDTCVSCEKRVRFGRTVLKCKECRSLCHAECKDRLPLPCVPVANTPGQRNLLGVISDYTPITPPMVPALVVHCVNEVEQRGLDEIGLYRIPGSEKDVKMLKEKFLRGKGSPSLKDVDIHVICGCVKHFLRSLTDPLVTFALWKDFVQAVEAKDKQDIAPSLYQAVSELPQPNRDTLAFLMLHLQKVAESPACKMPIENLAKVFGPTIVGYSSENPNPDNFIVETRQQAMVLEHLLKLPSDYWSSFVNVQVPQPTGKLQQTPSTDSLLRPTTTIFTPGGTCHRRIKRKQRFFATPPSVK